MDLDIEDQDLRILKAVVTNRKVANEFAYRLDDRVFLGDARKFAREVIKYIKTYHAPPTKHVFEDKFSKNPETLNEFNKVWEAIDLIEVSPNEWKYDLEKITTRFQNSKIRSLKDSLKDIANENFIKQIKEELYEIDRVKKGGIKSYVQKDVAEFIDDFKALYNARVKGEDIGDTGMASGFSYIDAIKDGLKKSELFLIGGENGSGKSTLMLNMAVNAWMQKNNIFTDPSTYSRGYNVLYFSLEMPYELCWKRTMCKIADVPFYNINKGKLLKSEFEGINKTFEFIKNYPFKFEIIDFPRGLTLAEAEEIYDETCERFEPDLVVFDYLALMDDKEINDEQDWLKLVKLSGKMHEFARVKRTSAMSAFQLNIPSARPKDPSEAIGKHRIGRAKNILDNCDFACMIETRKDEETYSDMPLHVLKNRNGIHGKCSLIKKLANCMILDQDPPYQPWGDGSGVNLQSAVEDISALLESFDDK